MISLSSLPEELLDVILCFTLFLNVGVPVNKPPPIDWFGAFKRMSPQLVYIQDEGEDYKSKRLLLEAVEDVLAPVPGQSSNSAR